MLKKPQPHECCENRESRKTDVANTNLNRNGSQQGEYQLTGSRILSEWMTTRFTQRERLE